MLKHYNRCEVLSAKEFNVCFNSPSQPKQT